MTLPGQLRSALRDDHRDLIARFEALAPHHEAIRIQRWTVRRIAMIAGLAACLVVVLTVALQNLEPAGFVAP